jgi:hypothetical protein
MSGQPGGDGADQMMHGGEGLHHKQLRNANATGYGNPANIVTHQIDDHQIFGAVFWRVRQLLRLQRVLLRVGQPGNVPLMGRV